MLIRITKFQSVNWNLPGFSVGLSLFIEKTFWVGVTLSHRSIFADSSRRKDVALFRNRRDERWVRSSNGSSVLHISALISAFLACVSQGCCNLLMDSSRQRC
jgi:hypothetical protein